MHLARLLTIFALLAVSAPASAQRPLVPERQVHVDLSAVGAAVGVAFRYSDRTAVGFSLGGGGNWMNHMLLGGRHFSEESGLSYATKDGAGGKSLYELARATVFVRTHFNERQHLDVGAKISGFLHSDSSDDDPGGGYFVGMNVAYNWGGWRRVNVASEMDIGRYAEPGSGGPCISGCSGVQEFGINVAPILVRFTFP